MKLSVNIPRGITGTIKTGTTTTLIIKKNGITIKTTTLSRLINITKIIESIIEGKI
jgi:hypothetical protein